MFPETKALPLTGERTVPGVPRENYWFRRHEAAYLALAPYCRDAVVLEAGCGEGYGAELLASTARLVCAVDYDALTAAHVAAAYPRVRAVRGNLAGLPVGSSTVDVVANLQVIEHLWDQPGFLLECHRVLRPGGRLLVTTPNRITFSPGRDTPLNPFHTRELAAAELDELLRHAGFTVELLAGLGHGPRLRGLLGGAIIEAQVAVAVDGSPWPDELLAAVTSVTVEDFVIGTEDLDASLDLIAVAVA
ncbi:class I SAM-dependent methyltransferase [Actinophytocola sp.]|uniref:class I SAM-dependent methyltransferase n=1 Tax=Actinophytocola sp. TaxID=1872138 RepID=UPI002D80BBC9|nr:methyltransferase domain-containing protein [Actinophytocola sp.]HET9143386.1 methyltransferase domain-containing protein [Actinophytocola sp.]HEU5107236.1 methyltransferase domain-containing protein [Micromonosporaceae bacterium]